MAVTLQNDSGELLHLQALEFSIMGGAAGPWRWQLWRDLTGDGAPPSDPEDLGSLAASGWLSVDISAEEILIAPGE